MGGTTDEEVVQAAYDWRATIVTANQRDFVGIMNRFLKKQMEGTCRDLNGLVVIPNEAALQKRAIQRAVERMTFGGRKITWFDVSSQDLCVSIAKDGRAQVARFLPCYYCGKSVARARR